MLTFVGLGLYDLGDVPVRGLECIRNADYVFLESYTSRLSGTTVEGMEKFYGREVRVLSREQVEVDPELVLGLAGEYHVAFLTGGDPMVSTTHIDLRMRACRRGIVTNIIHASSISTAVCGLSGLQNYRFGKSCSLPYPHRAWMPLTPAEVISANLGRDLHTLVYLDIREDRCMTISEAVDLLETMSRMAGFSIPLYVGVARAGSEAPVVAVGDAGRMKKIDFGPPLHILIIPAELHVMEREYLEMFAGL